MPETPEEKLAHLAKLKGIDLNKVRKDLAESLKIPLIDEKLKLIKNPAGDEILELVGDPTVMTQLLKICPEFFSIPYVIAKVEEGEKLNAYVFTTQLNIIKKSSDSNIDIDHIDYKAEGLLGDVLSKSNILIIPHSGLSYSTDDPYPLLILNKDGKRFSVRYSSATSYYKTNKYSKQVDAGLGASLNEDEIFSVCNARKDVPYMALTNNQIEGDYYLDDNDNTIKRMER